MRFVTKNEAQEAVNILQTVRNKLPRGMAGKGSHYICDNICTYSKSNQEGIVSNLHSWISSMLGGKFSLTAWLRDVHNIFPGEYLEKDFTRKLQSTRIRWIDWMIQEIKEKNGI